MALSRNEIIALVNSGELEIQPGHPDLLQTAGLQFTLGKEIAVPRTEWIETRQVIDLASPPNPSKIFDLQEMDDNGFIMKPGSFILGCTEQSIGVPANILCLVDGRSTMGRLGLTPQQAAMAIWPGHGKGPNGPRTVTLEIKNHGPFTIQLRPGLLIANAHFHRMNQPVDVAYDSGPLAAYSEDRRSLVPNLDPKRNFLDPAGWRQTMQEALTVA